MTRTGASTGLPGVLLAVAPNARGRVAWTTATVRGKSTEPG